MTKEIEWIKETKLFSKDEEVILKVARFLKRHYEFFIGFTLGIIIMTLALT